MLGGGWGERQRGRGEGGASGVQVALSIAGLCNQLEAFKSPDAWGPTPKDSSVIVGDEACALGFLQARGWLTCVTWAENR